MSHSDFLCLTITIPQSNVFITSHWNHITSLTSWATAAPASHCQHYLNEWPKGCNVINVASCETVKVILDNWKNVAILKWLSWNQVAELATVGLSLGHYPFAPWSTNESRGSVHVIIHSAASIISHITSKLFWAGPLAAGAVTLPPPCLTDVLCFGSWPPQESCWFS